MVFDLGGLSTALDTKTQMTVERQNKERQLAEEKARLSLAAAKKTNTVTHDSMKSAAENRTSQLDMYSSMDETLKIAQEGMKLSDSSNPLDRLQLWMLQQSDNRYTADGSTRRLQYLQGASSALASREVINQQKFQDEMTTIQADLTLSTMSGDSELAMMTMAEAQGQELIDAHTNKIATMAGTLQNSNAMQEGVLSNLTLDDAKALKDKSVASGAPASVGGISVSAAKLDDRIANLQARDQAVMSNKAALIDLSLADLDVSQTQMKLSEAQNSKTGFIDVNGVQVSSARLTDRLQNLQSKDMTVQNQFFQQSEVLRGVAERNRDMYLQASSIPDLDKIAANGGVIPEMGGMKIDLGRLAQIRDQKASFQTTAVNQDITAKTMADPVSQAADYRTYLDSLTPNLPPDSPVNATIATGKQLSSVAAKFASDGTGAAPGTPEYEASFNAGQALLGHRQVVDAAISQEAKRLSLGDDKKEMAYNRILRGQQVPESVVVEAIAERMAKKQPITDWLSGDSNGVFQSTYHSIVMNASAGPQKGASPEESAQAMALMNMDSKELASYATQKALEATKLHIAQGMTGEVMAMQLMPEMGGLNHPLALFFTPQKFTSLVMESERAANEKYRSVTNASVEDMARWTSDGSNQQLNESQAANLLVELDKVKPGLADKYMQWWDSPERQAMQTKYGQVKSTSAARKGFTDAVETGLVIPGIAGDMASYSTLLQDSARRRVGNQLTEEHTDYVTFGGDQRAKQAFLLQVDSTLGASQKRAFMDGIIAPLLAQTKDVPPQDAARVIEQSLRTMRPDDPQLRTLLSTVLKNRDQSLSMIDNFIQAQNVRQTPEGTAPALTNAWYLGSIVLNSVAGDPITREARGYEWLNSK